MGIINGKEFIDRLNEMENEIWVDGEKVKGKYPSILPLKGY